MSITDRLQCATTSVWMSDFSQCLFEWQTLISGFLAVFLATIGSILLYRQIKQVERHEGERRERRFAAARATLPLALSEITLFARQMVTWLGTRSTQIPGNVSAGQISSPPVVSERLVANLQGFIEAAHNPVVVDCVCEIIREIQTLSARAESLQMTVGMIGIQQNIDEYIVQSARLHVIAGNLFEFARTRVSQPPDSIPWSELRSYLSVQHHMDEQLFPGVYAVLDRREKVWESVWPPVKRKQA